MNPQVNWKKIRSELQRLADVDQLKAEVHRIGSELRQFDFHRVLSPSAQTKVKQFERRYADLMRSIHQAQRQMDREFNRVIRQIKAHRSDVSKVVAQQKTKLEQVSKVMMKKGFGAGSAKKTKPTKARTTTSRKKATTRKSK